MKQIPALWSNESVSDFGVYFVIMTGLFYLPNFILLRILIQINYQLNFINSYKLRLGIKKKEKIDVGTT